MEYEAFSRSMQYLLGLGLVVRAFVSDRHSSIAKHMREKLPNITHFFDIWHLKKSKSFLQEPGYFPNSSLILTHFNVPYIGSFTLTLDNFTYWEEWCCLMG
jgi:hypothetical protein